MNKEKKALVLSELKRYVFMILACFCFAGGLVLFLIPNGIIGSGISGLAALMHLVTGWSTGFFIVIFNLPILIAGWKIMGWRFILRCLITSVTLGVVTEIVELMPTIAPDDSLLGALYGGLLQGLGLYLFIKYEMSSGGTELLARITHHIIKRGSIAFYVAIYDGVVVVVGAIVRSDPSNILYALILIFITMKVSDLLLMGFEKAKLCYIITSIPDEVGDYLLNHNPRGITLIDATGMYTKTPKGVLLTCVKRKQIEQVKKAVKKVDPNAFVIVTDANEVYGQGFHNM